MVEHGIRIAKTAVRFRPSPLMSNIDNSPEIDKTNERSLAIEDYIQKVAEEYKKDNFQEVIDSLSDRNDQAVEFTDKYEIQIQHSHIPLNIDNLNEIEDAKYLPTIIDQALHHGHGWDATRMETPDDIAIYSGGKLIRDIDLPPLWKKVMALCILEEWIHVLDQTKVEEAGGNPIPPDELKNKVAIYLHDNLQIKLPRYFLEQYDRKSLNIPIEDHDFDEVKI